MSPCRAPSTPPAARAPAPARPRGSPAGPRPRGGRDPPRAAGSGAGAASARARARSPPRRAGRPPGGGKPIFDLPAGEMELGIGIHGEPGRRREPLGTASEIADAMVEAVVSDLAPASGARVLPFVNGMGGTPLLELYLLYGEIERGLRAHGLEPARRLVGPFITSLEMAGASLTLLELDDDLLTLWDAPVHTAALRWGA